eukprot:2947505-Karenia_brevis.AAC.1
MVQYAQSGVNSSKIGSQTPSKESTTGPLHSAVWVKGNKISGHMAVSPLLVAICSTNAFR